MWYNCRTLAQNARDVCSNPALGTVFPIFVTPMTLIAVTMILYKLSTVCYVNGVVNMEYIVFVCCFTS